MPLIVEMARVAAYTEEKDRRDDQIPEDDQSG
ncbi:hypothetical protein SDC9_83334 [bioreactor metagenome]|uniref:Uncharacterized protein n=1 Tax=bioreactor metagenome TaxID=1076179 RepID=A0A644Z7E7_9ZZZZ